MSKDSDFNDLAFIHGPPPKVIWLRVGNASTDDIGELLAVAGDVVAAFEANKQDAVRVLRRAICETLEALACALAGHAELCSDHAPRQAGPVGG